jgi:hypothetical protein
MVMLRNGVWSDRRIGGPVDAGATAATISTAPTLPRASSFRSGTAFPGSYWLCGRSTQAEPSLYVSSAARVLFDLRTDLRLTGGLTWSMEVFSALSTALQGLRPSEMAEDTWNATIAASVGVARQGEVIPLEALRAAIWFTYAQGDYPEGPRAVRFPETLGMPRVGDVIAARFTTVEGGATLADQTQVVPAFDANRLPFNPFTGESGVSSRVYNPFAVTAYQGESITVEGSRGGKKPGGLLGSNTGTVVALSALALLAMSDEGG